MPEGDTVFLAATRMHTALAGQRYLRALSTPRFGYVTTSSSPRWLAGTVCPALERVG